MRSIRYVIFRLRIFIYSAARRWFMWYFQHKSTNIQYVPEGQHKICWGLRFRNPLMNAAGMFKNGEGYDLMSSQGAGAYIGGTTTSNPRMGNIIFGIFQPFVILPNSHAAINALGLPNFGDTYLSNKIFTHHKIDDCPLGWSILLDCKNLPQVVNSLWAYHDNLQIDFIEINAGCPNIQQSIWINDLLTSIEFIAQNFLIHRRRNLPIIMKLSIDITDMTHILDGLIQYEFDGVTLGNTSINYAQIRTCIAQHELPLYDYFTKYFKGGVSGAVLKEQSLSICKLACEYIASKHINYEFHVIRSGGIDCYQDILQSNQVGVSLNQWYTGYFTHYVHLKHRNPYHAIYAQH